MSGLAQYLPNITSLKKANGDEVAVSSLASKIVFFYFSASWCPPCRGFTPVLAEFYEKFCDLKNFEVIFVSWDEEEESHVDYFAKMPWLAIDFSNAKEREALGKRFNVASIPTLIGVEADTGKVVTMNARARLPEDPEGARFPWAE